MLRIDVRVPEARDRTAVATLADGPRPIARDVAVASVAPDVAARRGNPSCDPLHPSGHPPYGTYALLHRASPPPECAIEYGNEILVFEPQSGPALEAESFGRLVLLAYAGPPGRDGRWRRTQGGLRFTPAMLEAIVSRLRPEAEVELRLAPMKARPWWAFWRRRPERTQPLSSEPPRLVEPPLDEDSLARQLSRGVARRPRRRADSDRTTGGESQGPSASAGDPAFRGGGGRFGGGGASQGWDEGTSGAARPPGVDAAGRIVGAVAGAAALGAAIEAGAAAKSAASDSARGGSDSEAADAGTQVNTSY